MSLTTIHLLDIQRENNPTYFELLDRHDALQEEWNRTMAAVRSLRVSRIPWCSLRELRTLVNRADQLAKEYTSWKASVRDFLGNPHLTFGRGNANPDVCFLYYMQFLMEILSHLDDAMTRMIDGVNSVSATFDQQVNFVIAIGSALLSLAGLITGLVAVWATGTGSG